MEATETEMWVQHGGTAEEEATSTLAERQQQVTEYYPSYCFPNSLRCAAYGTAAWHVKDVSNYPLDNSSINTPAENN